MASNYHQASVDLDSVLALRYSGWAQAANTGYVVGGLQDLAARYAVAAAGSAAGDIGYKLGGADIGPTFAAYGSTAVTIATQPSNVSGSANAGLSGTVTSSAATCAAGPQGGPTKTYAWHCSGCAANSPNSSTTTFSATVAANTTVNPTAYCTVSDGVTSVNTNTITVSLTNTYRPVAIAAQPSAVSGSSAAGYPSGTVTSNATSCAGEYGNGSYTYTWHLVTGSGVAFTAGGSASTAVDGTVSAASSNSGTMQCTVSDGVSSATTNAVAWSLANTTPAGILATLVAGSYSATNYAGVGYNGIPESEGAPYGSFTITSGSGLMPSGCSVISLVTIDEAGTVVTEFSVEYQSPGGSGTDPGADWFNNITVNGKTLTSASATSGTSSALGYLYRFWNWSTNMDLTSGDSYSVHITI